MLQRREATLDWMSEQVYRVLPLSPELQRIKDLFPELDAEHVFNDLEASRKTVTRDNAVFLEGGKNEIRKTFLHPVINSEGAVSHVIIELER